MHESKFWRAVAVVFCVGLLYVGHGLHNPGSDGTPSLVNTAHAGGLVSDAAGRVYTSNQDGVVLYVWDAPNNGTIPRFIATVAVPAKEWIPKDLRPQERK